MGTETEDVPDSCYLLLEDGTVLPGKAFGARKPTNGEVGELLFPRNVRVFKLHDQHVVALKNTCGVAEVLFFRLSSR